MGAAAAKQIAVPSAGPDAQVLQEIGYCDHERVDGGGKEARQDGAGRRIGPCVGRHRRGRGREACLQEPGAGGDRRGAAFDTADKARLRETGAGHVLTLSATPIPRTLQSALVGLRQLSIIATPPARRQPIRISVGTFVAETLRTALLREKGRGGQSFVVVPRIEDAGERLARVKALLDGLGAAWFSARASACARSRASSARHRSAPV